MKMAHCVPVPRMLFPIEHLCRRRWLNCPLVDGCTGAFMPKSGAGCTLDGQFGVQNTVRASGRNENRISSAKNHVQFFRAGDLSPHGQRNSGGSVIVDLRVLSSSRHESKAGSLLIRDCFSSSPGKPFEVVEDEFAGEEDEEDEFEVASNSKGELKAGLYLVGTPIGNLEDITLRALRVLKSAALILAEDTRHSSRLLRHYEIKTPTMSYHKFNEIARRHMVIERLRRREVLALISDAGMPGISDPGSDIVRACVEANVDVFPIPGPSAVITALVASGLPTDEFSFVGFLPAQSSSRQKRLAIAANESATQVFYVPPHKLCKTLDDCILAFGPSRRCAVAREMTKLHEEFWRGSLQQAQTEFKARNPRGEMTFIIEGVPKGSRDQPMAEDELKSRLQSLIDAGKSPSEATKQVVLETSARRNMVYPLALGLSQKQKS